MPSTVQATYSLESIIALGRSKNGNIKVMRGRLISPGNDDIDLHSAQDGSGAVLSESPYPLASPVILTISSTDSEDNIAGDGAQKIFVSGLDEHYHVVEKVIDMAGLSGASVSTGLIIHNEFKVQESGSSNKNIGDIFIGEGVIDGAGRPATVYGCIRANDIISYTTVRMLAANQVGLIKRGHGAVYRKSTNSSALIDLNKQEFSNGGYHSIETFPTFTKSNSYISPDMSKAPEPVGPRDMLKMSATLIDALPEVISGGYSVEIWTLRNDAPLV